MNNTIQNELHEADSSYNIPINVDIADMYYEAVDKFRIIELELFTGIKDRIRHIVKDAISDQN